MIDIAASNFSLSENVTMFSPPLVSRYTDTGSNLFSGGAGCGSTFAATTFLGAAFLGAAFFGAAFFAGAFFLGAAFFAAGFFAVGMSPPVALKVSITGSYVSWFDTDYGNSIVLWGRAGNCLV